MGANIQNCCSHSIFVDAKSEDNLTDQSSFHTRVLSSKALEKARLFSTSISMTPPLTQSVSSGKQLRVKVMNSQVLETGAVINIGPRGFAASPLQREDGVTYFGCRRKAEDGRPTNDFVVPCARKQNAQRGKMFMVYYDSNIDGYFLQDLRVGPGLFIKLNSHMVLRNYELINFGASFVLVTISHNYEHGAVFNTLSLEVYGPGGMTERKEYSAAHCYSKAILIGRQAACDVCLDDKLLSKVQSSIVYTNYQWVLVDGNVESGAKSTNGTWIYCAQPFEVYENLEFKFNSSLFKVSTLN